MMIVDVGVHRPRAVGMAAEAWSNRRCLLPSPLAPPPTRRPYPVEGGVGRGTVGASSTCGGVYGGGGLQKRVDGVVVLGGGLRPGDTPQQQPMGVIPPWAKRRLDVAAWIYRQQQQQQQRDQEGSAMGDGESSSSSFADFASSFASSDFASASSSLPDAAAVAPKNPVQIAISGGGSPHCLPVIHPEYGHVIHEGTAYAEYLVMSHQIPKGDILKESSSYDTVGNGYFSAMLHAVPAGWKNIVVVTSEFHMPRSKAIFDAIYTLVGRALDVSFDLSYCAVSDEGLFEKGALEARKAKEAAAVETWKKNMERIDTLARFHSWMHATHLCYSVSRQDSFGPVSKRTRDGPLKDSY